MLDIRTWHLQSDDMLHNGSMSAMFGLPQEVKSELKEKYGIEDAWPVVSPDLSVNFCNVSMSKGCPLCPILPTLYHHMTYHHHLVPV